jgi:hypothetical protein
MYLAIPGANGALPNGSPPNGSPPNGSQPNGSQPAGSLPNGSSNGAQPSQAAASVSATPFLNELFNLRNQDLAALYERYLNERNLLLDALREADGRHQHLIAEQATAEARLHDVAEPLTEEEATRYHYGERKAGHPQELVRRRRARDRQRERREAQDRLRDINRLIRDAAVAAGRARDALDSQLKAAQAAGIGINSYYEQRKSSYLSGLTHKHRRGPELLLALALTDPGLPEWLSWNNNALEGA